MLVESLNKRLCAPQDRYSEDTHSPLVDSSQDYELLGGGRNDTHTVLRFSREWETCDASGQDLALGPDTVRLIWAYHPTHVPATSSSLSKALPYHGRQRRGTRSVYLKEQPHERIDSKAEEGLKTWDLTADGLPLPNDDHTHYWCKIYRAPELGGRKHHMIGVSSVYVYFNPRLYNMGTRLRYSLSPSSKPATRATCTTWSCTSATCRTTPRTLTLPTTLRSRKTKESGAIRPTCPLSGPTASRPTHGHGCVYACSSIILPFY